MHTPKQPFNTRDLIAPPGDALSRLIAAAVVNRTFCHLLLTDPAQALRSGYSGQTFDLSHAERALVLSIRANNLTDFARQLSSELATTNGRDSGGDFPARPPREARRLTPQPVWSV